MEDVGLTRHLRKYSNSSQRIQWIPTTGCEQGLSVSSSHTYFHTSPQGAIRGVSVYVENESGEKFYLRVNVLTLQVTLECQENYYNVREKVIV